MPATAPLFVLLAAPLTTGAVDGDVGWAYLTHAAEADRRPLCPVDGEAFDVLFQSGHLDLEAARVGVDPGADGGPILWMDAAWQATVGDVDLWRASLPATAASRVGYVIEAIDGEDRDYLVPSGVVDDLPPAADWWTLDFDTLAHAPLGATPAGAGSVFRVWAPNATSAHVRGTFNGWSLAHPMTKLGDDWVAYVPGAAPGARYAYFFNGSDWRTDPRGRTLVNEQNFDARIVDPHAYAWQHPHFSPAPAESWVVYQLHVGTFAGRNDPAGPTGAISGYLDVAERVGHLAELGVNAVMLNPINEFPGEVSGGYNSVSVYAFEGTYGTADELKTMIDALHGAGIAVILDTVWNHLPNGDLLWNYDGTQLYFDTPPVGTPWGPQADIDRPEVLAYYLDSVETVFGEYKIDGYRHDAIYELVSATQWSAGQELVRRSMERIRGRFPDAHVIGEVYNNSAWNTSPGGIDLHGQYHEAYKNAIGDAIDAAAFGDPDMWRLANAIDGSGPWVEGDRVFNYFELHDEAWPLSGPDRKRAVKDIDVTWPHDDRYALGRTKLANGLTLLAQGMPALLMGTEWAEDADWEFEKIDWSHKSTYAGVFAYYRDLVGLRTTKRALFANSPAHVYHVNDGANVLVFERTGWDGRSYVVVCNFSNTDFGEYIIGLPRAGAWGVVVNSEDEQYQGRGLGSAVGDLVVENDWRDGFPQLTRLELPAHCLLLLQHEPEYLRPCKGADRTGDGAVDLADLNAVLGSWNDTVPAGTAGDATGDGVVDLADLNAVLTFWASADCG